MDYFYEQLEKTGKSGLYKFLNVITYVLFCIGIFIIAGPMSYMKVAVSLIIISIILFVVKRFMLVEYEYIFTNGALEIDIIYEMKRRRKGIVIDMKDAEIMAPLDSHYIKEFNCPKKNKKFYNSEKNIYNIVVSTKKSGRMMFSFTPDDTLVDMCFKFNPRNVKRK